MKNSRIYKTFSENTLAKIFLPLNLIVFVVIFKWNEFFSYMSKMNESGCRPIRVKLSFAIYDLTSHVSNFDYIIAGLLIIFSIFYLPSYLAALAVVSAMKSDYPHWCAETFDVIFIPIFSLINFMYLMLLSFLLNRIYDSHCRYKSPPEKPFSLLSD